MSQLNFITINERAYKYIRQYSIKSVSDALVELITNCVDAYLKTNSISKNILIDVINPSTIKIVDNALGLTANELQKCFLQIGNNTAETSSRGFFSRGAKDISAIGTIQFNAIRDNKYSQCKLNTDAYGEISVADIPVTPEIRQMCQINEPYNGLQVVIDLLPSFQNINIQELTESINKLGVLRDIMSDKTINITVNGVKLTYQYPEADLLLDINYTVPQYPTKMAKFVVYRSKNAINQPIRESEMEFGFRIKDSTSIYEVSTIDDKFRWNPYMNYIYGYLESNGIHDLLIDYDINGPSVENPFPIIDPSRLTGVNKSHPFIKSLFSIPLVRIDNILRDLNRVIANNSINIGDLDDLVDELNKYGVDLVDRENVIFTFSPTYDGELIQTIKTEREKYIVYEKSYQTNFSIQHQEFEKNLSDRIQLDMNPKDGINQSYIYDEKNDELINLSKLLDQDVANSLDNIMDIVPENITSILKNNPYLYKLSEKGQLEKLYVFNRGTIIDHEPSQNTLIQEQKRFKILFINDLNLRQRYIYETNDGVIIKINVNNPMVSKYLGVTDNKLENIKSTKSLFFFKELMLEILADIMLEAGVINSKIILDGNGVTNSKKLLDHRSKIIADIEIKIDNIFDRYITSNAEEKTKKINGHFNQMNEKMKEFIDTDIDGDFVLMTSQLQKILDTTIE